MFFYCWLPQSDLNFIFFPSFLHYIFVWLVYNFLYIVGFHDKISYGCTHNSLLLVHIYYTSVPDILFFFLWRSPSFFHWEFLLETWSRLCIFVLYYWCTSLFYSCINLCFLFLFYYSLQHLWSFFLYSILFSVSFTYSLFLFFVVWKNFWCSIRHSLCLINTLHKFFSIL